MQQCENCAEWVEDLSLYIHKNRETNEDTEHLVCAECLGHLVRIKAYWKGIEPGSPAAQRGYQKPGPINNYLPDIHKF